MRTLEEKRFIICFIASLCLLFVLAQSGIFNVINKDIMHYYNLSAYQISIISSLYFYFTIFSLLPAGAIYDHYSPPIIILVIMTITVIFTFLFSIFETLYFLVLYKSLTGICNAFVFIGLIRLVSTFYEKGYITLIMGGLISFSTLGGIIGHAPFAILSQHFGWKFSFFINSIIGLLILLSAFITLYCLSYKTFFQISIKKNINFLKLFKKVATIKQNWFLGIYAGLVNIPIHLLASLWGVSYLTVVFNIPIVSSSLISSMLLIGLIVGMPFFGAISDKLENRKIVMYSGLFFIFITTLFLLFISSLNIFSIGILFSLIGFFSSSHIIAYPTAYESNDNDVSGMAFGFVVLLFNLIGALSQFIFGLILDLNWSGEYINNDKVYSAYEFQSAMLLIPFSFILALFTIIMIRETFCRKIVPP